MSPTSNPISSAERVGILGEFLSVLVKELNPRRFVFPISSLQSQRRGASICACWEVH